MESITKINDLIINDICKNSSDAYQLAFYKTNREIENIIVSNVEQENCNKFRLNNFDWLNKNKDNLLILPDLLVVDKSLLTNEEIKILENLPIKIFDSNDINLNNKETHTKRIIEIESLIYESKILKYLKIQENIIKNVEKKYNNNSYNNEDIINGLINELLQMLEKKDKITFTHVTSVSNYINSFVMGLPDDKKLSNEEIKFLKKCALVHDIGKLTIPNQILKKTSKLNDSEYLRMQEHVNENAYLFNNELMNQFKNAALCHHERFDGKGYPKGLKGYEIPFEARVIAILDAFDAMTGDRKYIRKKTKEEAIEVLRNDEETHFDPELCEYFIKGLEMNYNLGGRNK